MHPHPTNLLRAHITAALVLLGAAGGVQADDVRLYREGAVPDPAMVARILGKPQPATRGIHFDAAVNDGGETVGDQPGPNAATAQSATVSEGIAPAAGAGPAALAVDAAPTAQVIANGAPQAPGKAAATHAGALALLIRFANGSAQLAPEARAPLDAIAAGLKIGGLERKVLIEGHANATGRAVRNRTLSQARAEAVRRYLIDHAGIPEQLLITQGFGAERPLPGRDPAAPENRRVQFRPVDA
jgi:outer membrane protein OmpA-like peptidoglycan-associated protein